MKVLKFGGTSVGTPESIAVVKDIINKLEEPGAVVVSAFGGVTDQIIRMVHTASLRNPEYKEIFSLFSDRHIHTVKALINEQDLDTVLTEVKQMLSEVEQMLGGVFMLEDLSKKTMDYLLSFGERLSAFIISSYIENAHFIDSREIIKSDSNFSNAHVDFDITNRLITGKLEKLSSTAILPGFIASDKEGNTTTLGRGGSDYTAAIIAAAVKTPVLEIWTDVDGFMTADPKMVKKAHPIDCMSYEEAMELSHFGAKVVYTPSLSPVFKQSIPVRIKNTFNLEASGTIISHTGLCSDQHLIKGMSSIEAVDLITVKGAGMVGKTGTSARVFTALARRSVNVILITQASSEMTISFAVNPADSQAAVEGLREEFRLEIEYNKEMEVEVLNDLSIIAIVGEEMRHTPGISAILYQSLGRNGISAIATAQGSSELNISVVIKSKSLKKALNAINEGFFLSDLKEIHLYLAGTGNVGRKLLDQIKQQQDSLINTHRLRINLVGITNSRKMIIDTDGIDVNDPFKALEQGNKADLDEYIHAIRDNNLRNSVFVDCTANETLADKYSELFDNYISIITANKIACSSSYSRYRMLKDKALWRGVNFSFETNVGAGLPIISTIQDLISSGDRILELEAVLSGTLNFIFNVLSEQVSLSQAIRQAMESGYSEPDPRLDLSGTDVKRKLLILAREAGYKMEAEDVHIAGFLPDSLFEGDVQSFLKNVEELNYDWERMRQDLVASGKRWRYVASLKNGLGSIGLKEVDSNHPAYQLEASNNIILLTTERYKELPLVVKGYGAGADVTAAGVFADVIRTGNL